MPITSAFINTEIVVKLLQVKSVGRTKLFLIEKLLSAFPEKNPDDALLAELIIAKAEELEMSGVTQEEINEAFEKGRNLLEESEACGIKVISYVDSLYPPLLRSVESPPLVINVRGNMNALNIPSVTITGTKKPSKYGRDIAEKTAYYIGKANINIVSSLQPGCEAAAHTGCLKAKGVTTAVLAHGLGSLSSKENAPLCEQILANNGCIISEYMIGTKYPSNFSVNKAKLLTGISQAIIIVETDIDGEAMQLAKKTMEFKRTIAAFNHPPQRLNNKSRGNQLLISLGDAISIETQGDLDKLMDLVQAEVFTGTPIESIQLPDNQ